MIDFKKIVSQTILLIANPARAWRDISQQPTDTVRGDFAFFYTLLSCTVVAAFVGGLIHGGKIPFVSALLRGIVEGITFFGSFWATHALLTEGFSKHFHFAADKVQTVRLIAYSMTPAFVLTVVIALFPQLVFLKILLVYTVYVVWEAVGQTIFMEENEKGSFVLLFSAVIVFLPFLIELFLVRVVFSAAL